MRTMALSGAMRGGGCGASERREFDESASDFSDRRGNLRFIVWEIFVYSRSSSDEEDKP